MKQTDRTRTQARSPNATDPQASSDTGGNTLYNPQALLKGQFHPKMEIRSSFTHLHQFLSSAEHGWYFEEYQ